MCLTVLTCFPLSMCVCMCVCTCMENKNVPFPFGMYVWVAASVQAFFLPFTLCISAPHGPYITPFPPFFFLLLPGGLSWGLPKRDCGRLAAV